MGHTDELSKRWWKVEPAKKDDAPTSRDLADAVFQAVRHIDNQWGKDRRQRNARHIALYENRARSIEVEGINIPDFGPGGLTLNVCSSCVDAIGSKILPNKPKPQYLTVDGDFSQQQVAKNRQRFTMGTIEDEKGYQKGIDVGLDCMIQDLGVMKLVPRAKKKQVGLEHTDPNELLWDERAARNGDPRELFQRKWVPTDVLCAAYPKMEEAIEESASQRFGDLDAVEAGADRMDDQCEVVEGWHLPSGEGSGDGRHVIVVRSVTLLDEPWKDDSFPFAFLRWTKLRRGFAGQGLVEQLHGIQEEITTLIQKIADAHNLLGHPFTFKSPQATLSRGSITNKVGEVYDAPPGSIDVKVFQVMAPEIYNHLVFLFEKAFEVSGISQLSATSRKPAGVESGVALRTLLDTETQRFALFVDAWQEFWLEVARQIMLCARRMGDATATWRSKEWARKLTWKDVKGDDDDERYVLQLWPVNLLPDQPAGKLAYVEQMITMGLIDPSQAQSLLNFPDIEAFQRTQGAGRDVIEEIIEHMLTTGQFVAPTKYMPLANPDGSPGLGVQLVQGALLRGQINGWPEDRLALLQDFLEQAEKLSAPPAPAGPAPMPGPPDPSLAAWPGAPGGAPMPPGMPPDGMPPELPPEMAGGEMPPLPPEMMAGMPPAQ